MAETLTNTSKAPESIQIPVSTGGISSEGMPLRDYIHEVQPVSPDAEAETATPADVEAPALNSEQEGLIESVEDLGETAVETTVVKTEAEPAAEASADNSAEVADGNAELKAEMEALKAQLARIESMLEANGVPSSEAPTVPAIDAEAEPAPADDTESESEEPTAEEGGGDGGDGEDGGSSLSPETQTRLSALPETQRSRWQDYRERAYKMPGIRRVIGKLEIFANQLVVDANQKRAVKVKGELDRIDMQIEAIDMANAEMQALVDQGFPGAEQIQLRMQQQERQKNKLLVKRDKIQTRFEYYDGLTRDFVNRRDEVCDKLISSYGEQLRPIETELENLQTSRDAIDLEIAILDAKHEEEQARLDKLAEKRTRLEETLRMSGMPERKISRFAGINVYDQIIEDGLQKMAAERADINSRVYEINALINEADAGAGPYRDKQDEFRRIKTERPIDMDVPEREAVPDSGGPERARVHTRAETSSAGGGAETGRGPTETTTDPEAREAVTGPKVGELVDKWNDKVASKEGQEDLKIDTKDFLDRTRTSEDTPLKVEQFSKILFQYFKFKKARPERFADVFKDFK